MPDAPISGLTAATVLAAPDEFIVVDKSDTTQASTGTTKRVPLSVLMADPIFLAGIEASLDSRYMAPVGQGGRAVFLGDSITAGSDDITNRILGVSWPLYASLISGQRIQRVGNAGKAGDTTAGMLARFDTDVTPHTPSMVFLLAGTNDVGATTFASFTASYQAIVAKIRAIGATPVLGTIPPMDVATSKANISTFNGWIRSYAATNGITLIDFFTLLVDPANGDYKSTYLNDGIHPNAAGMLAMGQLASDAVSPLLPPSTAWLRSDDNDPVSLLYKGCFGGYSGAVLPTGWSDAAGNSGSTISYTTDALVPGQMLTLTQVSASVRQLYYGQFFGATTLSNSPAAGTSSVVIPTRADYGGLLYIGTPGAANYEIVKIAGSSGGGPQTETLVSPLRFAHVAGEPVVCNAVVGDEMILSGVVTTDGGLPTVTVDTAFTGSSYSPAAMLAIPGQLTRAVFHHRFVIPSGASGSYGIRLGCAAGSGSVSFGRLGLYNATKLGV